MCVRAFAYARVRYVTSEIGSFVINIAVERKKRKRSQMNFVENKIHLRSTQGCCASQPEDLQRRYSLPGSKRVSSQSQWCSQLCCSYMRTMVFATPAFAMHPLKPLLLLLFLLQMSIANALLSWANTFLDFDAQVDGYDQFSDGTAIADIVDQMYVLCWLHYCLPIFLLLRLFFYFNLSTIPIAVPFSKPSHQL